MILACLEGVKTADVRVGKLALEEDLLGSVGNTHEYQPQHRRPSSEMVPCPKSVG